MKHLLALSGMLDAFSKLTGKVLIWLIMLAVIVCVYNAFIRYFFDSGSNAWLELQWYLYAAVFLLGGGHVFRLNGHVRIDFVSAKFSPRTRNWIDIIGIVVFLVPLSLMIIYISWPLFYGAYITGEQSTNANGLIRWPAYVLIPLGFSFLCLQSFSELIKRFAFLYGGAADPLEKSGPSEAQRLVKEIVNRGEDPTTQAYKKDN